jgi:hypothetical protein
MDEDSKPVVQDPNVAGWGANLDVVMGRKRIPKPKPDSRRDKWIRWLGPIHEDLSALAINRMVWRTLTTIWREREPQLPPSFIFDFFATTYAHAQASGVRRQVDHRDDVASLWRLLKEIEEHPEHLDHDWFVGRYQWGDQWRGDREFAALDPDGTGHIDSCEAKRDRERIVKVGEGIRDWVHKHVAHLSTTPSPTVPTFDELDTALDAMAEVFARWNCIFTGVDLVSVEPVPQYDFLAPLRVPWLLNPNG